jgi:P27 family predicted phage terminase small subunit
MRGRKNTPTALKILTGNPGQRALPENEPQFKVKIPKCPLELNAEGKKTWKALSKLLFDAGVLTDGDGFTLATYCHIWSQIVALTSELQKASDYLIEPTHTNSSTKVVTTGDPKVNPLALRLATLYSEHRSYAAVLGLDPSSRTKLRVNKTPKKEDKLFD